MAFINLLQAVYPVGAVYVSTVNTSPSSLIGGTWTQITNAALRASTSVGYTGADTHAITKQEMPVHNHGIIDEVGDLNGSSTIFTHKNGGPHANVNLTFWTTSADAGYALVTTNAGGGQAMSLVQRSYNCFIWYRTA